MTLDVDSTTPDADVIRAAMLATLKQAGLCEPSISTFAELGSTSDWLRQRLDSTRSLHARESVDRDIGLVNSHHGNESSLSKSHDGDGPALCVTDWQTAGNGRRGNQWQSEPGNITFSLLQTFDVPASQLLGLSLVTGVCVAETLAALPAEHICLKWPNDVLMRGAKLGGLLTELQPVRGGAKVAGIHVITGIGINLRDDPRIKEFGIGATSLDAADVDSSCRDTLVGAIAAAVMCGHALFLAQGWQAFSKRWHALDGLHGKAIRILREGRQDHATARGVNDQGALLVTMDGQSEALYSGDVSIRFQS